MNIGELKISKIQIVVVLLLLVGLGVGLYLATTSRIFKSKASFDVINRSFDVTGTGVQRTGDTSFNTETLNVNVIFTDPGILVP